MEHNREPRNKPTRLCSINIRQRKQADTTGKDSLFNNWFGKVGDTCRKMKLDNLLILHVRIQID